MLFKQDWPKWKSWNLTGLTQKWVDGSATNYGVILWATNEDTDGYDLRFRASEYDTTSERPYLEVIWSNLAKTVYFLKDHLGSIRAAVDAESDTVVGYDDYDPWGYILAGRSKTTPWSSVQGTAKNKFTGKEFDDEFGLDWYYFGARYYDPVIGRFLSVDLLAGSTPDINPYHYTHNNPVNRIDPTGLQDEDENENELTKEQLLKKIKAAQESGDDILSTVITEIGNAGDVVIKGETITGVLEEGGVELPETQKSELGKLQSIEKKGSKLTAKSSDKLTLKGDGGSLSLKTKVTADILTGQSEVSLTKVKGASVKVFGIKGGLKEVKVFKGADGKNYATVKVKVLIKTFTKTIPLDN